MIEEITLLNVVMGISLLNGIILIACLLILFLVNKQYTEILKEKSQRRRANEKDD